MRQRLPLPLPLALLLVLCAWCVAEALIVDNSGFSSGAEVLPNDCEGPSCVFDLVDSSGASHSFDLSATCKQGRTKDWLVKDTQGHQFYMQVCGRRAHQYCSPETFSPPVHTGVAVQTWGSLPQCPSAVKNCTAANHPSECCTQPCSVLATDQPLWAFADVSDPLRGGLVATLPDTLRADGVCFSNTLTLRLQCNPRIKDTVVVAASQNTSDPFNLCRYTVTFEASDACALTELSWGWVVVSALLMLWSLYIAVGMAWTVGVQGVWAYPNANRWLQLKGLVRDGAVFLVTGCKPLHPHRR